MCLNQSQFRFIRTIYPKILWRFGVRLSAFKMVFQRKTTENGPPSYLIFIKDIGVSILMYFKAIGRIIFRIKYLVYRKSLLLKLNKETRVKRRVCPSHTSKLSIPSLFYAVFIKKVLMICNNVFSDELQILWIIENRPILEIYRLLLVNL